MSEREELLKLCDTLIAQETRNPVSRTIRYEDVWAVARACKELLSPDRGDEKQKAEHAYDKENDYHWTRRLAERLKQNGFSWQHSDYLGLLGELPALLEHFDALRAAPVSTERKPGGMHTDWNDVEGT